MKPRYRFTAFVLLIAFVLLVGVFLRVIAQTKDVAADKKATSVEFKPGDAAQLALLRARMDELQREAKIVNTQISDIIITYHCEGCSIKTDAQDHWIGLDAPKVSPKP